jgi:hypothetical protein
MSTPQTCTSLSEKELQKSPHPFGSPWVNTPYPANPAPDKVVNMRLDGQVLKTNQLFMIHGNDWIDFKSSDTSLTSISCI